MAARKERTLPPELDHALYNLRVAGVSERAIYETLRDMTEYLVSYRDVRASLARQGVRYRREATERRKAGLYDNTDRAERPMSESGYLRRLEITNRRTRGELRVEAKDALDRSYALGYLARAGVSPDVIDEATLRSSLESIYSVAGS